MRRNRVFVTRANAPSADYVPPPVEAVVPPSVPLQGYDVDRDMFYNQGGWPVWCYTVWFLLAQLVVFGFILHSVFL